MNIPKIPIKRKQIRWQKWNYSQNAAYFVTIGTHNKKHYFGKIQNGNMLLNPLGEIVSRKWIQNESIYPNVLIDTFVVMPNHFHGIIYLDNHNSVGVGPWPSRAGQGPAPTKSLGQIIGQFKSSVTKEILKFSKLDFKWQRNYYDHIIRNNYSLDRIREYIFFNPQQWQYDKENPIAKPNKDENKFWEWIYQESKIQQIKRRQK